MVLFHKLISDSDGNQASDSDKSSLSGSETAWIPPRYDPIQGA